MSITTTTTGSEPDPDGYSLSLNGAASRPIDANATLTLSDLPAGTHSVQLAGVASNCTVSEGETRTVAVRTEATVEVSFAVTCAGGGEGGGSIRVTTATTGPDPDQDGYSVSLDGAAAQPIATNATLVLPNVTPGNHSVQLAGVAGNCTVSDGETRTVAVAAGATAELSFEITCTAGLPPESPTARLTITAPGGQSVTEGGRLELTVPPSAFVELTFDASRSSPGAGSTITAYEWQSNGEPISSEPTFTFELDEGTFSITLKVTSSASLSHSASATVDIAE